MINTISPFTWQSFGGLRQNGEDVKDVKLVQEYFFSRAQSRQTLKLSTRKGIVTLKLNQSNQYSQKAFNGDGVGVTGGYKWPSVAVTGM